MPHHDLLVIGTGSGNAVVDDSFDHLDVAFVEDRKVGGTCVNFGCIPSKMLAHTADVADTVTDAGSFGVDAQLRAVHWRQVRDRVFDRTDLVSEEGRRSREKADNITLYRGRAVFTGPCRVRVDRDADTGLEVTADRIVIATGGRPVVPPAVAESGLPYETSDTVMRIDAPPRRLAVLGGGYIAAELAHVFSAAGSQITIIDTSDRLLGGPQDDQIRQVYTDAVRDRYDLRLGTEIDRVDGEPGALRLTLDDGTTVAADMLLVAAGRTSNADRMNLAAAGVDVHDDGRIVVDEFCRTSADGVFALGDVSTPIPLKHVANREAAVVAHNLLHPDRLRAVSHDRVPWAVFTDPQIAGVGVTEQQARERYPDHLIGVRQFCDVAYGWAMAADTGLCKVIVDAANRRILGAHIIGPQAATLLQLFVVAMEFGIRADDLAHLPYWVHPALTEVVENALLDAESEAA
ncbi:mycothione reductase [Mycobacterium sp. WMMD1722]|uniref:mycothione reductase n=1 Tax=Mycobacterium sp. WMMD1722 TaxID=3404117 RepID=UPI003BF4E5BC